MVRVFACSLMIVFGCLAVFGAESGAQTVVITAKPKFVEYWGGYVSLIISGTNHVYTNDWGVVGIPSASLDTNHFYTFTITQESFRGTSIPQLRRVQLNGQTIYDIEICEVHKTKMELKTVPIQYGLMEPDPDAPSGNEERRLFPHGRDYVLGGCIIEPRKTAEVYVCPECEQAAAKWYAEMQLKRAAMRQNLLNAPKPHAYTVGTLDDGGTLSGVAKLFYGDASKWREIYHANRSILKDPNKLTGRETLTIPKL